MIGRLNRGCAYFPCHSGLGDCTFCYCPFYPCGDESKGRYVITKDARKVWSCKDCNWIHRRKVVDNIFHTIRTDNFKMQNTGGRLKIKKTGIIILGHGSKLKKANDTVRRVAKEIRSRSGIAIVEPAYLQLCPPDLQKVIRKVVKAGCKRVIIVPFFLFRGNHVNRDIPNAIRQEAKIHRKVELVYARNIGEDPRISSLVMDRIKEMI
jgi:Zn-finger protein